MAITVDYTEQDGSPNETISEQGIRCTRTVLCDWTDRILLCREAIGWRTGGVIYPPDLYDTGVHDLNNVYCRTADIAPHGSRNSDGSYNKALITLTYETPSYDVGGGDDSEVTYISETLEPAAEFITMPKTGLAWDTNTSTNQIKLSDDDYAEAPAKIIRMIDWVLTYHNMATIPASMYRLPGKVNIANVYAWALGKTFIAGTLLCGNPTFERNWTSWGVTTWNATLRFTYRGEDTSGVGVPWNKFPRKGASAKISWEYVYVWGTDDVVKCYEEDDFSGLYII